MKKLIIGPILIIIMLPFASCGTASTGPRVEKETPPMTVEEGKELTIETWEISDSWHYGPQSAWGGVMVGLETEREDHELVGQYLSLYDLHSRKMERVQELALDRKINQPPAIYEDMVVWASVDRNEAEQQPPPRNSDLLNWDVFLLDLKTGEVRQLTTEAHAQVNPRIYANTVVWHDYRHVEQGQRPRGSDIYAYDLESQQEKRLTLAPTASGQDLGMSANFVVWRDNRHVKPLVTHPPEAPDNNEIYIYDLSTGQERRITTTPANDTSPTISDNTIAWVRQPAFNEADVFVYDLENRRETQVSHSGYAAHQFSPSLHEDRIAWVDARVSQGNTSGDTIINGRQGQTDIYLYDLETQQEIQLTSTKPGEVLHNPVISDDLVVYEWSRMIGSIAYATRLDGKGGLKP